MTTNLREGERVHVQTQNFNGMATILYIAPGEYYPIQVEMDQPDDDGHKIQRIKTREIANESKSAEAAIRFDGPADPQRYIGEVLQDHKKYGYKQGQQFILGVISYPGVYKTGPATSFYIYESESMVFRGCMPAEMFKVIGPYVMSEPATTEKEIIPIEQVAEERVAEQKFIPEKVNYQQMSLLDFL